MENIKDYSKYILCYTRKNKEDMIYSKKLAYSMHIAYSEDGVEFQELNHNSGVLFAKATENDNGLLKAKSLKKPYLFYLKDGSFAVVCIRTEAEGENDSESKGKILLCTSQDLLTYDEIGLIDLNMNTYVQDVKCDYDRENDSYVIHWCDEDGNYYKNYVKDILNINELSLPEKAEKFNIEPVSTNIEGVLSRNVIKVSDDIAHRLVCRLTVPTNIKVEVPQNVNISSVDDLKNIKAKAIYSDGTTHTKYIDWNTENIDWNKKGTHKIRGRIHQDHYEFPIAQHRADPCIGRWNGKYYFIATNDADDNHTLYMREADTIPELLTAEEKLILDSSTYEDIGGLLWAPEFHIVDGRLYIFHGATQGEFFYEESHVMQLRDGGNPMNAEDWSRPHRVVKKDGTYLCEAGKTISLDMTNFEVNGEYYVVWSQRQFLPIDLGAWLYIAKVDPKEPWKLITDPVVISKPDYGWANNHVFVDEGPFALFRDNRIFLTFSSALVDATYVVGLLTAEIGADLLNPDSWKKGNYPLLTSRSIKGEDGPGHNAYVIDDEGSVWNTYHARKNVDGPRSSGIRRVHFDIDGYPVLDLPEDKDLNKDLAEVTTTVVLE